MVVDGRRDVLGSDPAAANAAIAAASGEAGKSVPLRLDRTDAGLAIAVGPGAGRGRVWLVGYDRRRDTAVRRGENAGRTIVQANVVRSFEPAGEWTGGALALTRPLPAGETAAAILQAADGRILGVARLER